MWCGVVWCGVVWCGVAVAVCVCCCMWLCVFVVACFYTCAHPGFCAKSSIAQCRVVLSGVVLYILFSACLVMPLVFSVFSCAILNAH